MHDCKELTDLSPLADCKTLTALTLPPNAKDLGFLRVLPALERIGYKEDANSGYRPDKTAAEFWLEYDAGRWVERLRATGMAIKTSKQLPGGSWELDLSGAKDFSDLTPLEGAYVLEERAQKLVQDVLSTIEQTRQMEGTIKRINDLSVEIQKDINHIIVAMQFQDITRQKLERLHKPTLGAATESLAALSHETQALLNRDLYRAVKAYAQSAIKPRTAQDIDALERESRKLDEAVAAAQPDDGKGEKKVELF
jgi:hypothetical protein